ncbi:MAG: serine/threonine protein kinase, partial [Rhodopirellula sp. JB044]
MLEIGEKYGLGTTPEETGVSQLAAEVYRGATPKPYDIGAENVTEQGRRLLEQQIQARIGGTPRKAVEGWKLTIMLLILALLVAVLALAS